MNKIILTVLVMALGAAAHDTTYKDGTGCGGCDSIHKEYGKPGILLSDVPLVNGKMHGEARYYNESGSLYITGTYYEGKLNGVRKIYYESGAVFTETWYRNELAYKRTTFTPKGVYYYTWFNEEGAATLVTIADRKSAAQDIIERSIASYPGNCPCPYNITYQGAVCGRVAAYARSGGYEPLCYEGDVSPTELRSFESQLLQEENN